jgi:hypothetical protein
VVESRTKRVTRNNERSFAPCVTKRKTGPTYGDAEAPDLGKISSWTGPLGISKHKYVLYAQSLK